MRGTVTCVQSLSSETTGFLSVTLFYCNCRFLFKSEELISDENHEKHSSWNFKTLLIIF